MPCPTFENLLHDLETASGDPRVRPHVEAGCLACARRILLIQRMLAAFAAGPLPEVAPALRADALALAGGDRDGPLGGVVEILGRLVFDSAAEPALSLRGREVAERHLLFRAGPFELDLAHLESGSLVGQVLADEAAPALEDAVCALLGPSSALESELETNGDFHFEGVRAGSYGLVLEAEGLSLILPSVVLEHDEDA